ncbi:MAG: rane protein of unknown function [Candidatus Saccharibacteria bacterium]|nr:rane protein of unknown function [Candidatus Saccharibacteria bacterium]
MSPRVKKIILSNGLTGFICWYGVEKVFQKTIHISVLQVSLMAIVYITISALLNIPTGILADKKGRRYALVLATISLFISTLAGGLSHNVWQYLIPIIFWGLFYTTQNGAYEAILYDTLKEEGTEKSYARVSGLMHAAFWASIFTSSVIGAWVGSHFNLRLAYFITLIPNALNIILALSLHEPKRQKHDATVSSYAMAKQGFKFLKSSPQVLRLAGTFLLISLLSWMTNEFGQLYFIELGFGVFLVGLLNAFSGLFQSFGNFIGHKFNHISVSTMTVLSMIVFITTFLIPVKFRYIGMAFFFAFVLLRQVFYISNDTAIQHKLPSNIRATTLSSLGMINDGILVVCYFGFGMTSQHINVRTGYLFIGLCGGLILITTRILSKKLKDRHEEYFEIAPNLATEKIDSVPR